MHSSPSSLCSLKNTMKKGKSALGNISNITIVMLSDYQQCCDAHWVGFEAPISHVSPRKLESMGKCKINNAK